MSSLPPYEIYVTDHGTFFTEQEARMAAQPTAMTRFEAEHAALRDAAENLFTRLETMRKFRRANPQIAAEAAAAPTDDTIVGGGTMTKSAVLTAMLLYDAGNAFAAADLALAAAALATATTEAEGAIGFSCEDAVLRMA
jgi:hypothetical protein